MGTMPASTAKELRLRTSISFFSMSTSSTTLAGIARINLDIRHGVEGGFVLDKLAQLIEAPIAAFGSGVAPNPGPQVNARQIFESNPLLRAFSAFDQFPGDAVINISLETGLLVSNRLEATFRGLCVGLLQAVTLLAVALAALLDSRSGVQVALAVGSDVHHAPIHTHKSVNCFESFLWHFARRQQVKLTSVKHQLRLTFLVLKHLTLALCALVRDRLASCQCPDSHELLVNEVAQDTTIKGNRPMFFEVPLCRLIQLVGIGNLAQTAHCQRTWVDCL